MKQDKTKNIIIIILLIIIIILSILIFLLITNKLNFNFNNNNNLQTENKIEKNEDNKVDDSTTNDETNTISNDEMYSSVINEYQTVLNNVTTEELASDDFSQKYSNVNERMVGFNLNGQFNYTYYDIDKNNTDELIITVNNSGKHTIIGIFTYDGTKPVKLIDDYSLGDRSIVKIYDNGILYLSGSSGASSGSLTFSKIASDGHTNEIVQKYYYQYDESNNVSYYSELDKYGNGIESSKFNYTSTEEIESVHLNNSSIVSMDNLTWKNI